MIQPSCVLDLETRHSARSCLHCGRLAAAHEGTDCAWYTPIGWDNHAALGLAIGCAWWSDTQRFSWWDSHTVVAFVREVVQRQPCLVTFNGALFDLPLLCVVLRQQSPTFELLIEQLLALPHYDLLQAIWAADPESRQVHGMHGLDALCRANGLPAKAMDGATAPLLWAQGRIAEVVQYCQGDVERTRDLYARLCQEGGLWRQHPEADEPWWLPIRLGAA